MFILFDGWLLGEPGIGRYPTDEFEYHSNIRICCCFFFFFFFVARESGWIMAQSVHFLLRMALIQSIESIESTESTESSEVCCSILSPLSWKLTDCRGLTFDSENLL